MFSWLGRALNLLHLGRKLDYRAPSACSVPAHIYIVEQNSLSIKNENAGGTRRGPRVRKRNTHDVTGISSPNHIERHHPSAYGNNECRDHIQEMIGSVPLMHTNTTPSDGSLEQKFDVYPSKYKHSSTRAMILTWSSHQEVAKRGTSTPPLLVTPRTRCQKRQS